VHRDYFIGGWQAFRCCEPGGAIEPAFLICVCNALDHGTNQLQLYNENL